jgi:predicted DNA-binding ribbon-helix-helix protein
MTASKLQNTTAFSLYEQDFYLWIETTVKQLKEGKLNEVNLVNLIEELEAMGRSEKHSLESNLRVVLLHLLKHKYQPQKRSKSWLFSIIEHRIRLRKSLQDSPSLKRYLATIFAEAYQDSRKLASVETGLSIDTFPELCPFTIEETLNEDFLPF